MHVDTVALLRELEVRIDQGSSPHVWLLRTPTGESFHNEPALPQERITSHVVRKWISGNQASIRPLFIGRTITPSMFERAKAGHFDYLTEEPLRLVLRGSIFEAHHHPKPSLEAKPALRPAWIRWAVERYLLLSSEPQRQLTIADQLGTSQQSVSHAVRVLGTLVQDAGQGLFATDKENLLDHWASQYAGPNGQKFGWYSLDSIVKQTHAAAKIAESLAVSPLVSGDVAADRLAPWRLPSLGLLYLNSPIDLSGDGFIPAPLSEATLITCVPRDPTLWRLADSRSSENSESVALADPVIVYRDVLSSNSIDGMEAAQRLKLLITGTSQ